MKGLVKYWLPVLVWAGIIFVLSDLPMPERDQFYLHIFIAQKIVHLVEYATLFILAYRAFLNTTIVSKKEAAMFSFLFIVIYGISDEYHQSFVPGRGPAVRDVFIDGAGGILAWIGIWKYLPKAPKRLRALAESLQIA